MDNQQSFGMEFRSVKEASVEGVQRRTKPKKHFMFCVKATWSDGTVNLVYRRYSEFLHLQTILYQAFPESLGRPGATCSKHNHFTPLPDTLSTRMNVGEAIFRRMEQVNCFLKEIVGLDTKVAQSKHIKSFLTPRPEDLEPEPKRQAPRGKKSRGRRRSSNFSQTMKGRLQKFGKTTKIFGNNISSPIVLEHFVVMEDYKKQAKTDINLKKGKIVDVIEKRECGWWLVDADGEVGWAPALYLEPADEMSDTEVSNVQRFPISKGEVFVTTKRYVAVEDDELSFDIGVNLQILEKNMDGWWKASYLGREGWVPQLYLRKLGTERRGSRTARRKSRIISRTELRSPIEEEEDVIQEIPEEKTEQHNTNKEDKRMSLPRKISKNVFSTMGKKDPKAVSFANDKEATEDASRKKTIGNMIEMSSAFLQLNQSEKRSSDASSEERKRKTSQPSPNNSTRPTVERRAISTLALSTHHMEGTAGNHEADSKEDIEAKKSKSRSLESLLSRNAAQSVESKWKPEKSNTLSSSLSCLHEVPESDHIKIEEEYNTQLAPPNLSNGLSTSRDEIADDIEATATLGDAEDSDTGSCDISSETTTLTDLMECLDGFCKQPVGDYVYYKKTSIDEDIANFHPPRRSPPSPSNLSNGSNIDSPRMGPPSRNPPSPNTYPRGQRQSSAEDEQRKNHTIPKSNFDRKIIFQNSLERETAQELNEQIQVWSSSDESESDEEQLYSNRIIHPDSADSPAIVIDELSDQLTDKGRLSTLRDDDARSTESFEIEVNLQSNTVSPRDEDGSTDLYYTTDSHEVDAEIYLNKGDFVTVIEKASTGYWLIQNKDGLRGWSFSGHFVPAHQVNANEESNSPEEEDRGKEDDGENNQQMFCRVICDYEADDDSEEIDIYEGDVMEIIFRNESGWWCVRNNTTGEIGWAPSNYLEMVGSEESYDAD